ncbi:Uncharacterized protein APZ42_032106 [Daphnia magna]|uniref:Uncharacterized protein n=1 Tax=Daphnia magna TaxID=35525 RepID=A0A164M9R7_9CRUS|nr:Uncharacterized protein APZ42_032106 [Daphnia magna]
MTALVFASKSQKIELTNKEVGTALRALLLTEPTILTPFELFKHCGLRSYYEIIDSDYESVHSGEQQKEETSENSVPIKIVRVEIHTQVEQIPFDYPKSTPSTTTITCMVVNHSQSSMNTQTPQPQLTFLPCNYLPYQGLKGRKVSITPESIVDHGQSVKIPSMYNKQSNNGTTPKYSVTSSIPKMNLSVMCPSKIKQQLFPEDWFLEGLSFDVQTRLKYKEFETFEKLIEKTEMTTMAVEEAKVRSRVNAFQVKYVEPNRKLNKVKEALDRLSTVVKSNTHQKHLEENMEKMQRQLSTRINMSFSQRSLQSNPPINKTGDL